MKQVWNGAAKVAATLVAGLLASAQFAVAQNDTPKLVHDAQYYVLDAQNGEQWAAEDKDLDARLAALRQKYGRPPNIIHLMWDDQPFGAVGIPALQQIRGYTTPKLNQMADEGMLFTRMYSQPSCTPTRAAAMTGQIPVRNGMDKVGASAPDPVHAAIAIAWVMVADVTDTDGAPVSERPTPTAPTCPTP